MKLILTRDQAESVLEALEWAQNDDYPDYDPINAKYIRIQNKILKALGKQEYVPCNAKEDKELKAIANDYSLPIEERIKKMEEFERQRQNG